MSGARTLAGYRPLRARRRAVRDAHRQPAVPAPDGRRDALRTRRRSAAAPLEARPSPGPAIDEVIAHGLAKLPAERPATALALMDEAEQALRSPAARAPHRHPRAGAHPRRQRCRRRPRHRCSCPCSRPLTEPRSADATPSLTDADPRPTAPAAIPRPTPTVPPPCRPRPATSAAGEPVAPGAEPHAARRAAAQAAPPRASRPRRGRRIAGGGSAALAVAGGFLAGSGDGDPVAHAMRAVGSRPSASRSDRMVAADLRRRYRGAQARPPPWRSVLLTGPPRCLIAGFAPDGVGPTLLPASFRRLLSTQPRRDDRVKLARGLQALRYAGVRTRGATPLTLFLVPTSAGTLTVACSEAGAGPTRRGMRAGGGRMRLRGARAFALGADGAYVDRLAATLKRLQQRRTPALAGLRERAHPDRTEQARARRRERVSRRCGVARARPGEPAGPRPQRGHRGSPARPGRQVRRPRSRGGAWTSTDLPAPPPRSPRATRACALRSPHCTTSGPSVDGSTRHLHGTPLAGRAQERMAAEARGLPVPAVPRRPGRPAHRRARRPTATELNHRPPRGQPGRAPWDAGVSRLHAQFVRVGARLDGRRRRAVAERHVRQRHAHRRPPPPALRRPYPRRFDRPRVRRAAGEHGATTAIAGKVQRRRADPAGAEARARRAVPAAARRLAAQFPRPTGRSPTSCTSASTPSRPTCARSTRPSSSRTSTRSTSARSSPSGRCSPGS